MTFYERELRKLLEHGLQLEKPTFVGRNCYARLNEEIRIRLEFVRRGTHDQYEGLKATLINRNDGPIDSLVLWFGDVMGVKKVDTPYLTGGIMPYIWVYRGIPEWYAYQPTDSDYQALSQAVNRYAAAFQEPQNQRKMGMDMK